MHDRAGLLGVCCTSARLDGPGQRHEPREGAGGHHEHGAVRLLAVPDRDYAGAGCVLGRPFNVFAPVRSAVAPVVVGVTERAGGPPMVRYACPQDATATARGPSPDDEIG